MTLVRASHVSKLIVPVIASGTDLADFGEKRNDRHLELRMRYYF